MSANLPIEWADKKNSPLLADFIAKYGSEYCMTAEEINQLRDAVNEMAVIQQSTFLGTAEPTFIPAGTGRAYWISLKPGTYPNHGNVVVGANEIAFIVRNAAGAFSISQTTLVTIKGDKGDPSTVPGPPGPTGTANTVTWTAIPFAINSQVNLLGKDWVSNAATLSTDIPGTSSKWVERLSSYLDKTAIFLPNLLTSYSDGIYEGAPNKDTITLGIYAGYSHSNLIPCLPLDVFVIAKSTGATISAPTVKFFDVSGNYVSTVALVAITGGYKITVPSTAGITQFGFNAQTVDYNLIYIKKGSNVLEVNSVLPTKIPLLGLDKLPLELIENTYPSVVFKKDIAYKLDLTSGIGQLVNAGGTLSALAAYTSAIDFLPLYNAEIFTVSAASAMQNIVFYNEEKKLIQFVTNPSFGTLTMNVTKPLGAKYYRFSIAGSTPSNVLFITSKTIDRFEYLTKSPTETFVSLTGNDTTGDGSIALPYRTYNKARTMYPNTEIVFRGGDYLNEPIAVTNTADKVKIRGYKTEVVRLIFGQRITAATLESGYTKVFKADSAITIQAGTQNAWQHDINEVSSLIALSKRDPYHKNKTHRLSSSWILKATSLADIEASSVPKWFNIGTAFYFSKVAGSDITVNPIIIPDFSMLTFNVDFELNNLNFLYKGIATNGTVKSYSKKVASLFNNSDCFTTSVNGIAVYEECEVGGAVDGFGGFNNGNATEINCWGHDCQDETSTFHDNSFITRKGGLYEYAVAGTNDVGASKTRMENCVSRYHSGAAGFDSTYYLINGANDGNMVLINCVTDGSIANGGAAGRVKAYNCKALLGFASGVEVI